MPSTYVCPDCNTIVPVGTNHFCTKTGTAPWNAEVVYEKNDLEKIIDRLDGILRILKHIEYKVR